MESPVRDVALVAAGGALGAAGRWVLGGWLAERFGPSFPWHTMVINVSGALLLGVLMGAALDRGLVSSDWRVFLGTGVLGGYTTFSTLAYESVALLEQGLYARAALDMFGSGVLGIVAAVAGLAIGRAL
jgi:CrcB protein